MSPSPRRPGPTWFRRMIRLPDLQASAPDPAASPEAALSKLDSLLSADEAIPKATRSRMVEPTGQAAATILIWHGFTNAPSQFSAVADQLARDGYRVLLPRMPHHGLPDLLNRDLATLTPSDLTAHVNAWLDVAAGFGSPVWVIGLSAGATLAGWAAATRNEVSRLVLAAPLVAPVGFPMPLVRIMVKSPAVVPRIYWWWDPRKKADLGHSPYAYPGFPVPGLIAFLRLSEALIDGAWTRTNRLQRVALTSNPGDFAIRGDVARAFAADIFAPRADTHGEARIEAALHWMHDFVDPWSPGAGSTDQVVAVLSAALGTGDPTAGGVLVPPLLVQEPA